MDSLAYTKVTAAEWLFRRTGESWNPEQEAELERWLNASTGNRITYLRLQATWQKANRLKVLGAGMKPGVVPSAADWESSPFFKHMARLDPVSPLPAEQVTFTSATVPVPVIDRRRPPKLAVWGLAAGVLLAVAFSGWKYGAGSDVYSTPIGGLASVPMSDGSKVTLNTNSMIEVDMTDTERRVELKEGEAFFEVTRDAMRPFVVEAGDKRIVVLGTKFSVRRDGHDVRVAVTEGLVRINDTLVSAGSVARAEAKKVAVVPKPVPEVEESLSWRSGYVVFHETPLADAVAEFNRYNTRKIYIQDPSIAAIRIGGNFLVDNVDVFTHMLEDGFPLKVERSDRIVLTAK